MLKHLNLKDLNLKHLNLKHLGIPSILIISVSLFACQDKQKPIVIKSETAANQKIELKTKEKSHSSAIAMAKKMLIVDTHIDVPYRLEKKYEDVSISTEKGDFDYPRAVKGGLNAAFMSIYIPAELEQTGGSKALADRLIDSVEAMVKKSPGKFNLAYSTEQVQNNFKKGLISLPMGMENGSPMEGKIENLQHFYQRGIRYITLTHAKANHISDSSYDENRPAKGLTDFGKKLVVEMNNIGIMVDVSHISDDAFYQVMEISQVPVIASHSSARYFTPGFERNMSDEMIKLLAKNGGVIQINFGSTFISQKSIENNNLYKAARDEFMQQNQLEQESEAVKEFSKEYREKNPFRFASLDELLDQFSHVINLVGVDHVGIGSDFDGVGDSLPEGMKDISNYPSLIQGLLDRGCNESDIQKIVSGNVMRVWQQTEDYAAAQKTTNTTQNKMKQGKMAQAKIEATGE